jgi:hypothetical protein
MPGQTAFLNGDFENTSAAVCATNCPNATFNSTMPFNFAYGAASEIDIYTTAGSCAFGSSQSGTRFIGMNFNLFVGDAFTFQLSSPLVPGTTYTICYWDQEFNGGACCAPGGIVQIGTSSSNNTGGTVLYTGPTPVTNVWTQRMFSFVAPAANQYISVTATGYRWTKLDNFVITANGTCMPPLAELGELEGHELSNGANRVSWKAWAETEIDRYVLERSSDARYFTRVDSVFSNGAEHETTYNLEDQHHPFGENYYRIKMVDRNGGFQYTRLILLKSISGYGPGFVSVYPNPGDGRFRLELQNEDWEGKPVYLLIINESGSIVYQEKSDLISLQNKEFNDLNLSKGLYFVHLIGGGSNLRSKFVVAE